LSISHDILERLDDMNSALQERMMIALLFAQQDGGSFIVLAIVLASLAKD